MGIEEKDVKVKISYCPECGGACRIAIEPKTPPFFIHAVSGWAFHKT